KGDKMDKTAEVNIYREGANLNYMIDYSLSALEYSMLVLWSVLKRGGKTVLIPIENATLPFFERIGSICGRTTDAMKSKFSKIRYKLKFPFKADTSELERRLFEIETIIRSFENNYITKKDLMAIEERLEYLEKHGIVASQEGGLQLKGKKLSEEKIMFLRAIVRENINLLED
ncbi:MAG: hypothetical protein N2738_06885, partial [Thermodesulfovibrionales bacterium]|nr:hypothetical protein [Thermodesulfovibrionales bacterium]